MREVFSLDSLRTAPDRDVVLGTQGIPQGHTVSEQVEALARRAARLYESLSEPRGIIAEISLADFREVYEGEGENTRPAPLPGIVERADGLALFAATLGDPVSTKIQELFEEGDPGTACMLDGIASERAEIAAIVLAAEYGAILRKSGSSGSEGGALGKSGASGSRGAVLPYSPGYCGWHITAQKRLFAFLAPEEIGIRLSSSCLMSPIKSVSGVLVAGAPDIHDFDNDFDFCFDCESWECRARIASIAELFPPES